MNEVEKFLACAAEDGLVEKIVESAFVMVTDAHNPDLRIALEIGVAILFEKPLLIVVPKDQAAMLPRRVRELADEVVEMDGLNLSHPLNQAKMIAALSRIIDKLKRKGAPRRACLRCALAAARCTIPTPMSAKSWKH